MAPELGPGDQGPGPGRDLLAGPHSAGAQPEAPDQASSEVASSEVADRDEDGPGSSRDRPGGARRRRRLRWALASLGLAVVLVAAGGVWVSRQLSPPGGPGARVVVGLPGGSPASEADLLARHGVITSAWLFKLYARLKAAPPVQAGAFALRRHDSFSRVLATLEAGPPTWALTIPEGFTLRQIAARVARVPGHTAAGFLAAAASGRVRSPLEPPGSHDLEGLLFPATYSVGLADSDDKILSEMVSRFAEEASLVGLDRSETQVGLSPYQVVIVASIVEREANATDRGMVARVIYNRLRLGMKLQIDATVSYGLGGKSPLSSADLRTPTPYNTYLVAGLPPTPIANPGEDTLRAALAPTPGCWLYYVNTGPGGQQSFSCTYAGQKANEALGRQNGVL
ncbi:MAG TPA: endolytic transglycosylase MltG [Acidimicrobiales bacterium]|nr:endolytic transglycosylase MltG [Acidimicrobiales bacterium]